MKRVFQIFLFLINIIACVAVIFSGYGGRFNPEVSTLPGVALMIFPLVCGTVVILILLDLLMCRRMAFLPALALLVCAPSLWNICPLNIGEPTLPPGYYRVKIMTYNVYNMDDYTHQSGGEISRTLSNIIADDADIVCLQEAPYDDISRWSFYRSQADTLMERYPYREGVGNSMWVLSKFPTDSVPLRQASNTTSCMFQCVKVDVKGTMLTLFNIHLQSIGLLSADKQLYHEITTRPITKQRIEEARYDLISKVSQAMRERAGQAHLLREQIDATGTENVVVAGDFNDIEGCYAERVIAGRELRSVYTSVSRGPTITYYADRLYFNIDHVLYGPRIIPLKYHRGNVKASDHYSVSVELAVPKRS